MTQLLLDNKMNIIMTETFPLNTSVDFSRVHENFSLSFSADCVYCYLVMRPSSIFHCLLSAARLSK